MMWDVKKNHSCGFNYKNARCGGAQDEPKVQKMEVFDLGSIIPILLTNEER